MTDHDGMTIRGKWVRHTTLQRDFVCGECGGGLALRAYPHEVERRTEWRTVCVANPGHDPNSFIHKHYAAALKSQRLMEQAEARDILAHLPAEFQTAIKERRGICPSRD